MFSTFLLFLKILVNLINIKMNVSVCKKNFWSNVIFYNACWKHPNVLFEFFFHIFLQVRKKQMELSAAVMAGTAARSHASHPMSTWTTTTTTTTTATTTATTTLPTSNTLEEKICVLSTFNFDCFLLKQNGEEEKIWKNVVAATKLQQPKQQ